MSAPQPARIRRINTARGHRYVDEHGQPMPGVTTILGDGMPKPALTRWAANAVAEYAVDHWDRLADASPSERMKLLKGAPWAERDRKALRGTQVHAYGERLVAGHEIDVPDELRPHVENYARFLDDWDVQPVLVEATVYSLRWGYAGTLDLVADVADGRRLLADVKTAKGVYGETAAQLAAYRYAPHYVGPGGTEESMPEVDGCAVVHVRDDGYDLVPVEAGPAQHRVFLYIAQVAKFAHSASDLVGAALDPPSREDATA